MWRLTDLMWRGISALVLLPIFGFVSLAIVLDDGFPIFFRQSRLGRHRKLFQILKFRTMRDQRITRVGAWLRQTGLDETAQWLNVLRGDMSWIGPRPLTAADVARLGWDRPEHDPRFLIRPGMTGLAQLLAGVGRGCTRGIDRLYRQRRGVRLNLWIVGWSVALCVLGKTRSRRILSGHRWDARSSEAVSSKGRCQARSKPIQGRGEPVADPG